MRKKSKENFHNKQKEKSIIITTYKIICEEEKKFNFLYFSFQKKIFNKVKHDLEQWREVLVLLNGILKWEQSFFPGVIAGVITFIFIILWWLDLSLLTSVALSLLLSTVLDYGYPLVSKFIFKPENWSGTQEKLYEQIINDIVDVKLCVSGAITSFFNNRAEKSTFVSYLF